MGSSLSFYADYIFLSLIYLSLLIGIIKSFRRQGSLLDSKYTYDQGPNNPPITLIFGPLFLATNVYQLSPTEVSEI